MSHEIEICRRFECCIYAGIPDGQYATRLVTITLLELAKRGQDADVMSAHA